MKRGEFLCKHARQLTLTFFWTWLPNSPAYLGTGSGCFGGADSAGFCCAATIGASTGTAFLGSTGFSFGFSFFGAKKWINSKMFILYADLVSKFDKAQMCIRCEKEQKSKASTFACMWRWINKRKKLTSLNWNQNEHCRM